MNKTTLLCYWLQGFVEINQTKPTPTQWKQICINVIECPIEHENTDTLMKPEAFITWLKGFVELANPESVDARRWNVIKEHLGLVFVKVTSNDGTDIVKEMEKVIKKETIPPVLPYSPIINPVPFGPNDYPLAPTIICSTEPTTNSNFCLTTEIACSTYKENPL